MARAALWLTILCATALLATAARQQDFDGLDEGLKAVQRRLLASGGVKYNSKDGPLSITITANYTGKKGSAKDQCKIQGANPKSNNTNKYIKGPLTIDVPVGQTSMITLKTLPGTSYKNYTLSGSKNVTTVLPTTAPSTVTFKPDNTKEESKFSAGLYYGSNTAPSCTLHLHFLAKKS